MLQAASLNRQYFCLCYSGTNTALFQNLVALMVKCYLISSLNYCLVNVYVLLLASTFLSLCSLIPYDIFRQQSDCLLVCDLLD